MGSKKSLQGVDLTQEQLAESLARDVRPTGVKFKNWLATTGAAIIPLMCALILAFEILIPRSIGLGLWLFLLNYPFFNWLSKKNLILPFKKPKTSNQIDEHNLHPATGKPQKAEGICFYGNNEKNGEQIWFANDDVRTHTLIFGTTGSGKTEALLSLCMNSLIHSSGFIYIDGKGDNSLFIKIFSMVRRMGREDDLLVINYMTGTVDTSKKTFEKLSNTMNPFASGSADALTELIVSLLPDGGGDGMWKGRAAIFMSALMRVLVALRNDSKLLLDVSTIRQYFSLEKIEELVAREDVLPIHKEGLKDYLINLPGYKQSTPQDPNPEQDYGVYEQHGFITMQYTEAFGLLSDTYGHMMKTQLAEVDFYDVVVNRRILCVLLPALEKSPQSLANLGKIIVASVRAMMSAALGSKLEGNRKDVIDAKPTNSPSPYITVFDEYGYYAVAGAAVMPAQARSLGFAMIFAGQDFQAFKKGSPEDAASIVANCAIKICMKLEDPSETLDIFNKAAGESKVAVVASYQRDQNSAVNSYYDQGNVSLENRSRISSRDLKAQGPGECHIIFGDTLVRAKMFYANPEIATNARLNSFLKVQPPSFEEVNLMKTGYNRIKRQFNSILKDSEDYKGAIKEVLGDSIYSSELGAIFKAFDYSKKYNNIERSFFAVSSYVEKVSFVDNKIILELEENDKNIKKEATKEIKNYKENIELKEKNIEKTENQYRRNKLRESEKIKSENTQTKEDSAIQELRKMVAEQNKVFNNLTKNSFDPYEEMNIESDELKMSISDIETEINKSMYKKVLLEDKNKLDKDYNDLIAEQTVLSLGMSTLYPGEDKIKSREANEKIINTIIDDILIDDIED